MPDRPFILCADDYALAPGVSRAIIALIGAGRLSATGCMTLSPDWPEHAGWLKPWAGRADIGLHLTMTDHAPLAAMPTLAPAGRLPPLGSLMAAAWRGRLRRPDCAAEITAEVARQIDAFEAAFGVPPDFIDGHQHVHLLPGVREHVLDAARHRLGRHAYLRSCAEPLGAVLARGVAVPKTAVIAILGRPFARAARTAGLRTNARFRGVYDFATREPVSSLFARFLAGGDDGLLVMCHPGFVDDVLRARDPLTQRRADEYAFLAGDDFPALLARTGRRVARYAELPGR